MIPNFGHEINAELSFVPKIDMLKMGTKSILLAISCPNYGRKPQVRLSILRRSIPCPVRWRNATRQVRGNRNLRKPSIISSSYSSFFEIWVSRSLELRRASRAFIIHIVATRRGDSRELRNQASVRCELTARARRHRQEPCEPTRRSETRRP